MKRMYDTRLTDWKKSKDHKTLLVRGARQVGKTFSVRHLGGQFEHFLEVNFEEHKDIHVFFKNSLDPEKILEKLSAYFSVPIKEGKTLVFFDEIQACPEAMASLRFFHEKKPNLHVIAAGSLLEFALAQLPSYGVGRITSLFMYPLSFDEFLISLGEEGLLGFVKQADRDHPLDTVFHDRLVDHFKTFQLIGGFPEVVAHYTQNKDIGACFKILDDLITTFIDDFAKYKTRLSVERLTEVFRAIVFQCGHKFKYSNIPSQSPHAALKQALFLLERAGLATRVCHTSAQGLPLGAQVDESKFKVLPVDTGLMQRLLGLDVPSYLTAGDFDLINKGGLAEVATGLELIKHQPFHMHHSLYYWQREKKGGTAEVDYVIQKGNQIVPIEVKSGTRGQMQSLHLFLAERKLRHGVRISLENFCAYDNITVIPLYAVSCVMDKK